MLRQDLDLFGRALGEPRDEAPLERYRSLALGVVAAQRACLREMRRDHTLDADAYYLLQEELDWRELTLLPEDERQIEES